MDDVRLDTDTLSEVFKQKNIRVLARAKDYLRRHRCLAFSAIAVYEVVRGLRARNATRQLSDFLKVVSTSDVFPVSMPVLMRAAELWAEAHNHGRSVNDADLIIAATALELGRPLVTGNTRHYA